MARICMVCKKELPEGSRLPVCEYHKGVAKENAKKAAAGVAVAAVTVGVAAKDKIGPIVVEKAAPAVAKAIKSITKH